MVCSLATVLAVGLLPVNVLFAMMCQLVCCNDRDRLFTRIKIDLTTYYQPAHQNPAFVCFSPPLCCHCRCCRQRLCSVVVVLVLPLSLPMLPTWWLIWMGNGNNDDGVGFAKKEVLLRKKMEVLLTFFVLVPPRQCWTRESPHN